jgi:hypothetical protein
MTHAQLGITNTYLKLEKLNPTVGVESRVFSLVLNIC